MSMELLGSDHLGVFYDEADAARARAFAERTVSLATALAPRLGSACAAEIVKGSVASGRSIVELAAELGGLSPAEARRLLDEAGLGDTAILASNELDEQVIEALKAQGAAITVWGVGTRLVTGWGEPALGGVYKLSAVRSGPGAPWTYRVKLSEQVAKTTIPGVLQVRRYRQGEAREAKGIWAGVDAADPEVKTELAAAYLSAGVGEKNAVPMCEQALAALAKSGRKPSMRAVKSAVGVYARAGRTEKRSPSSAPDRRD